MREELADIETDAAGADDRHRFSGHLAALDDVEIGRHLVGFDPRDRRLPRADASGQHDMVEAVGLQRSGFGIGIQAQFHAGRFDAFAEVAQRLVEVFLAGNRFAMLNCPPMRSAASNSVTSWPRSAAVVAHAMPAGPAPTTATFGEFRWA